MHGADGFIAVDWGTTNRRAYRIDSEGTCVSSFEDQSGVLSVPADGFAAAAADVRARLGDLPMLLAGMVGSTRGWVEAPYVACPAGLDDLAAGLSWIEPGRTAIVPGLSVVTDDRADVMRGEEVQLFGAIASGLIPGTSFVCHPGTHNKWVTIVDGRIISFRTVMTGEMFSTLRERGILTEMLTGSVVPGEHFIRGVRRGLSGATLTAELFSARAQVLLGQIERDCAPSYVSGLLIGADLGVGLGLAPDGEAVIMGDSELTGLYAAAAADCALPVAEIDGGQAFVAGAFALARSIP